MAEDKKAFLKRMAKGNPVDLDRIVALEHQIEELEKIGLFHRPRYSVTQPLVGPSSHSPRSQTLAKVAQRRR